MTDTPVDQDVVDILTTDHHEVLDLLQQIKISADAEERRDLADTVISELLRHLVAEEMYVYPAMKKYLPDGDEAVDHDVEEHKELEQTMKKLESGRRSESRVHPTANAAGNHSARPCQRRGERAVPRTAGPGAPRGTDRDWREGGERKKACADPAPPNGAQQ
jgi:hypothetical protein